MLALAADPYVFSCYLHLESTLLMRCGERGRGRRVGRGMEGEWERREEEKKIFSSSKTGQLVLRCAPSRHPRGEQRGRWRRIKEDERRKRGEEKREKRYF
jgi:hypothetical protein